MSKLNDLIKELCPNGVEHKKLGDICLIETGKLNANAAVDGGAYPFFTTSKQVSYINSWRWDCDALLVAGNANVGDVKHYCGKFEAYQRTYVLSRFSSDINSQFLYYVMASKLKEYLSSKKNEAAMTYIVLSTLQSFPIPIPPLKIQQEIVKILDKFTELQAELQAELELRSKQYEYYRDDLLSFDKLVTLGGVARRAKLLDIVDYEQPTKYLVETTEYDDSYAIPVLTAGKTFVLGYTNETDGIYNASTEDPVIIFDDFTTDSKWVDFPFKVKSSAMKMLKLNKSGRETALLRWIYLCMQRLHYVPADHSRHWISKYSNLEIPLPPLEVQKRLVNVLDNFESICADLDIGLPAEIKLRQQQYEYYRDELLSFKLTNV